MSAKTREQLYSDFSNNQTATGEKFKDLIDSFKMIQAAVSDPAASGTSITFIATISQNTNGEITVTKKTVNFSGYQTTAGMAGYQNLDLQKVDDVTVGAGQQQDINHNMKHYPTVRLLDVATGLEVLPSEYQVKHGDVNNVSIILGGSLTGSYKYILD
jgi:hypothetical protein